MQNSRFQVAAVLTLAWIAYLAQYFDNARYLVVPAVIITAGFIVDKLLRRFVRAQHTPYSSLVTTLLVAFIVSPEAPLYVGIVAVTLGLLSKYVFRTRRHWFNPAAFGIFISAILFGVFPAWWLSAGSRPATVIILVGMLYILYKLKRLWIPLTFLAVYYTRAFFLPRGLDIDVMLDGTVLLFAFVMVSEPITSPSFGKWKYGFGLLIALFVLGFDAASLPFSFDTLLASLLIGNSLVIFLQGLPRKTVRPKSDAQTGTMSHA